MVVAWGLRGLPEHPQTITFIHNYNEITAVEVDDLTGEIPEISLAIGDANILMYWPWQHLYFTFSG